MIGPGYTVIPGGKGANQAVAAAGSGVPVGMAGCVGVDTFGELLLASLAGAGVDAGLVRWVGVPTGCAAIGVDRTGTNLIMVAGGANYEARADGVPDAALTPATMLVLQMETAPAENWALVRRAHARGAKVLLNVAPAAPVPADVLDLIDLLVVNEGEALAVARHVGIAATHPVDAARSLAGTTGGTCVVTLGGDGAVAWSGDGSGWRIGALPITPVDTTAAGDAFVGWLAARLAAGDGLPTALRWATVASGIACLTAGAQPSLPAFDAVAARMGEAPQPDPAA